MIFLFLPCASIVSVVYIIINPLNSYLYIHWILDFKSILLLILILSFEQGNYTMNYTTPVFVVSTMNNCIFCLLKIQLPKRLILTARSELASK